MKKGLVIKTSKKYALVLSDDSKIEKIKLKPSMSLGQKIYFFEADKYKIVPKSLVNVSTLVASFLIILIIAAILKPIDVVNAKPYAVVTVDINPSIEILINSDNEILDVNAINEDARTFISDDLVGKSLEDGLEWIINKAEKSGYFLEEQTILISSAILDFSEEEIKEKDKVKVKPEQKANVNDGELEDIENIESSKIEKTIQSFMDKKTEQYEFLYTKGTEDAYRASKSKGLSLGKYQMLKFLDEDITQEEINEMKISEIANRKQEREQERISNKEDDITDSEKVVIDDVIESDEDEISNDSDYRNNNINNNSNNNKNVPASNNGKGQSKIKKNIEVDEESNNPAGTIEPSETTKPTETPIETVIPTIKPKDEDKEEKKEKEDKDKNENSNGKNNGNSNNGKSKGNN